MQSAALGLPPLHSSGGSKRKSMGPPAGHPIPYETRPPLREYQFLSEQPERLEDNQFFERATTQLNLFPGSERTFEILQQSRVCFLRPSLLSVCQFVMVRSVICSITKEL